MASTTEWPNVEDLPIDKPPSLHAPFSADDIPDDDDMGFNDPQNVLYINMKGEGLPERFRERIAELEQMLLLTHQLLTIHVGIQVKRRKEEGALPSDSSEESEWRRASYRTRVQQVYFQDGIYPWMVSPGGTTLNEHINVEKRRFHWEILSKILVGILLPRPIAASLEAIFQSIGETITGTRTTGTNRTFWNICQVYTYDEVRDDIRASLRNISYTLDQRMHEVVRRKRSETFIDVFFSYVQAEFTFNETTWKLLEAQVAKYILDTGIGNITNPPDVPV
jgi:hypothetical protein